MSVELDLVEYYQNMNIFPGQRVLVYDHLDKKHKTGTVIKRYGLTEFNSITCPWRYPDLCDVKLDFVRFKHEVGEKKFMSNGHFTYAIKKV
jgi:hypothetical protein